MATQASQALRILQALRIVLAGLLTGSGAAGAQELSSLPEAPAPAITRVIDISEASGAPELYVSRGIAVVLQLQRPCDVERTRLLDGEGYFHLLVFKSALTLLIEKDISPKDRFRLVVTFDDGTVQPFIVTAHHGLIDQNVHVVGNPDTQETLQWRLTDAIRREWLVIEDNQRLRRLMASKNHALARLLAARAVEQTQFLESRRYFFDDRKIRTCVKLYRGRDKTAAVFTIANNGKVSWKLLEARLSVESSGESRPFVMDMDRLEILPQATDVFAVVVDRSAFVLGNRLVKLKLKIYRKPGIPQASIVLDPAHAFR